MGLVSCLATSSSTAAAAFVMPEQADEVRALSPPMDKQKKVVDLKAVKINMQNLKMPAALPKVFEKLGRKREREVVADVELSEGEEWAGPERREVDIG
ncbi:hypothetical protein VE04_09171 [Pseudogymnoascus sp. 24MN13]|nr:hypothetical protein VE04_09171 [Pseudogymnoascus sp. 24MN13]